MRDFFLSDFKEEVVQELMESHAYDESEIVAVPFNEQLNETISRISGKWEHISQMIPLLKEMGYTEMRLYYEDCGIWVLQWHNPKFDNSEWVLISYD